MIACRQWTLADGAALAVMRSAARGPFQAKSPACYRASWQMPGPAPYRQATTRVANTKSPWTTPRCHLPFRWAHDRIRDCGQAWHRCRQGRIRVWTGADPDRRRPPSAAALRHGRGNRDQLNLNGDRSPCPGSSPLPSSPSWPSSSSASPCTSCSRPGCWWPSPSWPGSSSARAAPSDSPSAARANPGTRPTLSIGHGPVARPSISVRDAGELLAGVLQLVGPLEGPAESAGGLAAHVGGRSTAGEVDVLAPVHPPRVGAAGVAWEVPGQLPEEPVHALCPPAVPP